MASYQPDYPYAIRQFEIERIVPIEILGQDVSFTTSASAMITTVLVVALFVLAGGMRRRLVPGRLQGAVEAVYVFIGQTVVKNAGPAATAHIPFVFTLFAFILVGSLIGLTPVKFTFTSHLAATFGLALIVFFYVTALGFIRHKAGFLKAFLPDGTPLFIAPLIFVIEIISYLFRPVTLGVRLFANVLAGHIIIKLFADFSNALVEALGAAGLLIAVLPLLMNVVFFAFETIVFLVQSYIFVLLTCIYIRASEEMH